MKNIAPLVKQVYAPHKALLFYQKQDNSDTYIEAYDMDTLGRPINAHPLSEKEGRALALCLSEEAKRKDCFLHPTGLFPENVIYTSPADGGCVVWYSLKRTAHLCFKKELGILDGEASLPPLLWRASSSQLWIWALAKDSRPELSSPLYCAPFFNCHSDGRVCMGTVDVAIPENCSLEKFMAEWERYFFRSAFSHLLGQDSPVNGNIVQLWQKLTSEKIAFPLSVLKKTGHKLKNII